MCGIFALIGYDSDPSLFFEKGSKRGPEMSKMINIKNNYLGFHRLAINGLTSFSGQPLYYKNYILICNGEIYNYTELIIKYKLKVNTKSDCEVIAAMYELFGVDCVKYLDGEFAFVLYDTITEEFFIARDPFGVRPLYMNSVNNSYCFASDIAPTQCLSVHNLTQFTPGTYMVINPMSNYTQKYFSINSIDPIIQMDYISEFYNLIGAAIYKRVTNTERPIAALLSGGLDSSIVAALATRFCKKMGIIIETYSIGLKDSEDLKFAKKVALHIGSNHTEIICTEEEFYNAIPQVIYDIESYDTTSVRASVGNWLVGKYIKEHSKAKVILNGDGADELMGGYMYFHACPENEFDSECKRLLENIQYYDVLRSDKSISSHGLEPRTPYLDIELVKYYLNIPIHIRNHTLEKRIEKYFIRSTIQRMDPTLLPHEVLFRKKEAFSDGVSGLNRSWYEIIQEKVKEQPIPEQFYLHNVPTTKEQKYYRYLFETYYPNCGHLIPYYWMPRFVKATDASARTLSLYSVNMVQDIEK